MSSKKSIDLILNNLKNKFNFKFYEVGKSPKEIKLPSFCPHGETNLIKTIFDGVKCYKCEPNWLRNCLICTAPNYRCSC